MLYKCNPTCVQLNGLTGNSYYVNSNFRIKLKKKKKKPKKNKSRFSMGEE